MIQYNDNDTEKGLTIYMPSTSPSEDHDLLMKGICVALRLAIIAPDSPQYRQDLETMLPLVNLLDELLPNDKILLKGYKTTNSK